MPQAPSFEKLVVTGGTGFIGQHLLESLIRSGYNPTAIRRRLEKFDNVPALLGEHVRWIELDLLDQESVSRVIEAEKPSVLFHLAGARGGDDEGGVAASRCHALNVKATAHLLEVANRSGTERIVIAGSAEEYGNQTGPFNESSPLEPVSEYGKSKAEATRRAIEMHERENCPVVIVRPFTVYGPRQPPGMFISDAVDSAVNNASFSMSEGTQQRDLIFVDDVIVAMIAAAHTPGIEGKVFNLGSGQPIRLRDLAQMIWKISNSSGSLNIGARARKSDDMQLTWADCTLARKYLGWSPKVDLEMGLGKMIDWARKRS